MVDEATELECRMSNVECRMVAQTTPRCLPFDIRDSTIDNPPRGGFVYWMLLLMGLATFTPCVVLPEWREYQALRMAEQTERHRLDEMQRVVDRERNLLEAMQSDPAVIGRLAQRDLHFRRPGDTSVAVSVPLTATALQAPFVGKPIEPPVALARARSYLPDFNYDALFCDNRTRPIIMVMSVGLIVTAIALFSGKTSVRNP
jgi:hypothetical protein